MKNESWDSRRLLQRGLVRAEDGAGQEHADRFAADAAGADHAFADVKNVLQREVGLGEPQHLFVVGDEHPQQLLQARLSSLLGRPLAQDLLLQGFGFGEGPAPKSQRVAGGVQARPGHVGEGFRNRRTVGDGNELIALARVQQVHGARMTVLHLDRVDVGLVSMPVDVDESTGAVADRFHGVKRMAIAEQCEVRRRGAFVEEAAGEHKEIAEHAVAAPIGRELRQRVKNVVTAQRRLLDGLMHSLQKRFEAAIGVQAADRDAVAFRQQRPVRCEPEIDQRLLLSLRLRGQGLHKGLVVFHGIHLPHHGVAGDHALQHVIQARQSGARLQRRSRHPRLRLR